MNIKSIIIVGVFLVSIPACFSTNKVPSEKDWSFAIDVLKNQDEIWMYHNFNQDTGVAEIEFQKFHEKWYVVMISVKNNSANILIPYVGYLENDYLYYVKVQQEKILTIDDLAQIRLLKSDSSLWILIDNNAEFNNKEYYKSLWKKSIIDDSYGDGTKGKIYSSLNLRGFRK